MTIVHEPTAPAPSDGVLDRAPGPEQMSVFEGIAAMFKDQNQVEMIDDLAKQYGGLFQLTFGDKRLLFATDHAIVAEMAADPRWSKVIHQTLKSIRAFGGDGLFTAYNSEDNWGKAHRLLMPAFGPMAIRDYFPQMLDIAEQMFTKWERFGPSAVINVTDDMTRLTLDTIALCAFDYRFNSFYSREMHPYVGAMVRALVEAGAAGRRIPGVQKLLVKTNLQNAKDLRYMEKITQRLVAERQKIPADQAPDDLLQRMLTAADPLTGEKLSMENVQYQLTTFLIAGHETTSGLLSFVTYELLANPDILAKARAVVDEVLGDRQIQFDDIADLGYLNQILRESLRLHPTAPAFGLKPDEDVVLGGKYRIRKGEHVMIMLPTMHRDPDVWADPERFDPDRFAPGRLEQIPEYAWMPFGHGERACIGRPFALQEATMVLAMMLQRFDFDFAEPYEFAIKETLTIKPKDLAIKAKVRKQITGVAPATTKKATATPKIADSNGLPLTVLYGSNTGGCEGFARTVASEGVDRGWNAVTAPLDEYVGKLPTEGAVIIVTSSYNGTPPDNAAKFVEWVESLQPGALKGVRYSVMGAGNRDWASTYQEIPRRVDAAMAAAGAHRIRERGEADARGDFFGDWEQWYRPLWDVLGEQFELGANQASTGPSFTVEVLHQGADDLVEELRLHTATVLENRELVNMASPYGRSKRHLEIDMPAALRYRTGDYLSVLPRNHPELVARVAKRLGLSPATTVRLASKRSHIGTGIPANTAISVGELLGRYVDLHSPATRSSVEALAGSTKCPPERVALERLRDSESAYAEEVLAKRVSVADLLEIHPSCEVDLAAFLTMATPLRMRQYSISSSNLEEPDIASLTVAVLDVPARSGIGRYHGAGSTFLQSIQPGSTLAVSLTHPSEFFRPPTDNCAPIVMIAAGSGIAPFRGFIRERVHRARNGEKAGPTVLFFGCDHPDVDDLYAEEFAAYAEEGLLEVHKAYTFAPDGEITFVQHRLWAERERVAELVESGGRIFVCGDGERMAPAVHDTLVKISAEHHCGTDAEGEQWLATMRDEGRYVQDVFS